MDGKVLMQRGYSFSTPAELEIVHEIKEQLLSLRRTTIRNSKKQTVRALSKKSMKFQKGRPFLSARNDSSVQAGSPWKRNAWNTYDHLSFNHED